jgi:hypothetical protein
MFNQRFRAYCYQDHAANSNERRAKNRFVNAASILFFQWFLAMPLSLVFFKPNRYLMTLNECST